MNRSFLKKGLATLFCGAYMTSLMAQVTLDVDAGQRGPAIGDRHYGIFFEEINHAGDGGLYAELIQNRSFEDNASAPDKWEAVGQARLSVTTDGMLNSAQQHALELEFKAAGDGVRNEGFWGIDVVKGQVYKLSFWIKGKPSYDGTLTAELQNGSGETLGRTPITVKVGAEWTKITAEITATGEDKAGNFVLESAVPGDICLDVVSLFPPTYKGRENGCRIDLAEKLAAMKPSFIRFPGGCYVEGFYANGKTNRFEWKITVGAIEERPGHMNQNWGYNVTDGFGFHEMLQLAEDIGAEPLFVVNMGMGHAWVEDYNHIDEYIQEALDAIEYCNGDAETTKWGALRAKNGHPEPFHLRLLEIGNENYNFSSENNSDQSDHYAERYEQFRKAIKDKYPDITLIGNVEAWGTDNPTWRNPYPVDAVDEHYYRNPSWFVNQYNKYDTYSRSNHKIYVGEYAVTSDFGTNGNLNAALGEAVFMQGMENNSDVCAMNSYAPIFVNENNYNWRPDMIRFNSYTSYGTPSYYVQQLFPNNVGKENVKWTEENNSLQKDGKIGLGTWSTSATFDNVKVTDGNGNLLFSDDFSSVKPEWTADGGQWNTSGGILTQSDVNMQGRLYVCQAKPGQDYTYEVDATKLSGSEGFLIAFNYTDADNYCWWNLGGWGNTIHGVELCQNGSKSTLASVDGSMKTGQTYHIKIVVKGTNVKCYLDDTLVHDFTLPMSRKVYVSSNIDDEAGILYLKLVNPNGTPQSTTVNLKNASAAGGSVIVLTGASGLDENTLEHPDQVSPKESTLDAKGQQFTYEVPAYSVNVIRLNVTDVQVEPGTTGVLTDRALPHSFDNGPGTDDSGNYQGKLHGDASIVTMNDGNKALYTGSKQGQGFFDFGADMARASLSGLTGDYTLSVDIALSGVGQLEQYCWAYAFADGTDKYIGLVNSPNNTNWYYTIKDEAAASVTSQGGLSYQTWHNLTYVQADTVGRWYIDGFLARDQTVSQRPAHFADAVTEAYIGRSPFSGDALMSEAYVDNFRIYGQALDADQVAQLYARTRTLSAESAEVALQADTEELKDFMKKFNALHADTDLPETTAGGTAVEWSLSTEADHADEVSLNGHRLTVARLPQGDEPVKVGVLTAVLQTENGEIRTDHPLWLAPDDNRYGYLYCFMNSGREITNFALGSKEDKGHVFNVLLNGDEIFDTYTVAGIEHGTRDAYIGRGEEQDGYFITTTDMKEQTSGVWNNRGIDLVRSKDLIHWESTTFDFTRGKSVFSDPEAVTGIYDTDEEYARIDRVWAPQFIWDKDYNGGEGAYLVYYSLLSTNEGDSYDRIYYSSADREFKTLTQPRLLFDPGISVIDADIVYNPYDSLYHMYYKREGATGNMRGIYEATSGKLVDGDWKGVMHVTNEGSEQVEGSTTIRRINEDVYNLYYMRYSGGSAYKYCETDHLGLNATPSAGLEGTGSFQHGSMMTLTEDEYRMLQAWSDVKLLLPSVEALSEKSGSTVFDAALDQARAALADTDVDKLSVSLPAAYAALQASVEAYTEELCHGLTPGGTVDLTFLLVNPGFDDGGNGWSGTDFTATSSGVAEFYDKTFDKYQTLYRMPAGTYRLQCQGFYRFGDYVEAYPAHQNGSEQLLAMLYLNDESAPFMSLFDGSAPYTFSPYTYPDNVQTADSAFNRDGEYADNKVECTLEASGDLKVGLAKTEFKSHDWTCFDNFNLWYVAKPMAIREVATDAAAPVDVYTVDGIKVRSAVDPERAVDGLPHGIYIVGRKKIAVK
ncbi:MAG: carbohydrate binding domain-containing protein [Paraprevotella sp.]|nr:carbohydrate binding domain-containing protein [Paraprevotella sp.]